MRNLKTLFLFSITIFLNSNCGTVNNENNKNDENDKNKEIKQFQIDTQEALMRSYYKQREEENKKKDKEELEYQFNHAKWNVDDINEQPLDTINSKIANYQHILSRVERMQYVPNKEEWIDKIKILQKLYVEKGLELYKKAAENILEERKEAYSKNPPQSLQNMQSISKILCSAAELERSILLESDILDELKNIKDSLILLDMDYLSKKSDEEIESIKNLIKEKNSPIYNEDDAIIILEKIIDLKKLFETSQNTYDNAKNKEQNALKKVTEKVKSNWEEAQNAYWEWEDSKKPENKPKEKFSFTKEITEEALRDILQLKNQGRTKKEIETIYKAKGRNLFLNFHPDKKNGSAEKFIYAKKFYNLNLYLLETYYNEL